MQSVIGDSRLRRMLNSAVAQYAVAIAPYDLIDIAKQALFLRTITFGIVNTDITRGGTA